MSFLPGSHAHLWTHNSAPESPAAADSPHLEPLNGGDGGDGDDLSAESDSLNQPDSGIYNTPSAHTFLSKAGIWRSHTMNVSIRENTLECREEC